jgi:hypothetical protein
MVGRVDEPRDGSSSANERGNKMRRLILSFAALLALVLAGTANAKQAPPPPPDLDTPSVVSSTVQQVSPAQAGMTVAATTTATAAIWCYSGTVQRTWGTWPYQQVVTDHTYWCGPRGGNLTYRSTNVTHNGSLCNGSGDYSFRLSGGVGTPNVTVEAGAYFNCPTTIPFVSINKHRWIQTMYTSYGDALIVGAA